jgi:hypothetical protein
MAAPAVRSSSMRADATQWKSLPDERKRAIVNS